MSRTRLDRDRSTGWSRAVVLVTALAVAGLTVWILTPIILANLNLAIAHSVGSPARELAHAPRDATDPVIPTPQVQAQSGEAASSLAEQPAEPETSSEPPPVHLQSGPAIASANSSVLDIPAEPSVSATIEPTPEPGAVASRFSDDFGSVPPLPRPRPGPALATANHLGVPLPRSRPYTAPVEVESPDKVREDALFSRMAPE